MATNLTLAALASRATQPRQPLIERPSDRQARLLKLSGLRGQVNDAEGERQKKAQIQQIWQQSGGDLEAAGQAIMAIDPQLGDTILAEAQRRKQAAVQAQRGEETYNRGKVMQEREDADYARKQSDLQQSEDAFKVFYEQELALSGMKPRADIEQQARMRFKAQNAQIGAPSAARKVQNVSPGQTVIDEATGETIFAAPAATQAPRAQVPGTDIPLSKEVEAQRARMAAAGRAPKEEDLITVQTTDANGKPVTRIVPKKAGSEFPSQPTAETQNRATALGKIGPILNGISELSEKINVGKGIEAKARGEAEKAKARLNYNDDIAEYEALISGFTPMIARAVGHTGVLTQQDVDSVKALFPAPGDSKTLRDRKIARINTILSSAAGVPKLVAPASQTPPQLPGGNSGGAPGNPLGLTPPTKR